VTGPASPSSSVPEAEELHSATLAHLLRLTAAVVQLDRALDAEDAPAASRAYIAVGSARLAAEEHGRMLAVLWRGCE
jgi:hypothetical protein